MVGMTVMVQIELDCGYQIVVIIIIGTKTPFDMLCHYELRQWVSLKASRMGILVFIFTSNRLICTSI